MIKYYEDVFPEETHKMISDLILGKQFPWYYYDYTVSHSDVSNLSNDEYLMMAPDSPLSKDSPQFVHIFNHDGEIFSDHWHIVEHILFYLEQDFKIVPDKIMRVKANLITKDSSFPEECYNKPHIDMVDYNKTGGEARFKTFLYYVNDSDGDTVIFNERMTDHPVDTLTICDRIKPKANSAIYFDSSQYHSSSPPRDSRTRVVINMVFDFKDYK